MKTLNIEEIEFNRLQKIKKCTGIMLYRLIQEAAEYLEEKYKDKLQKLNEQSRDSN